jgi:hypothetical protein
MPSAFAVLRLMIWNAGAVAQQAAFRRELAQRADHGHGCLRCESGHSLHLRVVGRIDGNDQHANLALLERSKRLVDLGLIAGGQDFQPLSDGAAGSLGVSALRFAERIARIDQDRDCGVLAQEFAYQLQAFGRERTGKAGDAGHVAAGPTKALDKSFRDGIAPHRKYDRYGGRDIA